MPFTLPRYVPHAAASPHSKVVLYSHIDFCYPPSLFTAHRHALLLYGACSIAEAKEDRGEIVVRNPRADAREPPKSFFFDAVFGDRSAQERVYEVCGAPLVESVLQGYNGTIFAYGQVQTQDVIQHASKASGKGGRSNENSRTFVARAETCVARMNLSSIAP